MVQTFGLSKTFKDSKKGAIEAVKSVDFTAPSGQITGLLGANGAGKTTVLRMLSTVIKPTAGTATVAGCDIVKDPRNVRRSIGFLSNSTALYGRLSGEEMLLYFGGLYEMDKARLRERMAFVREKLQLDDFIGQLCDKMSTGQKQRISIARAILHDPPVLFFDEPTAGLDVVTSQTIMEFIEESRTMDKTVILSTHIMSEVERLCDRVTIIHAGTIRAEGSVDDIRSAGGDPSLERAFLHLIGYFNQEGAA